MGIFLWLDVSHCSGCDSKHKPRKEVVDVFNHKMHQKHFIDVNHSKRVQDVNREKRNLSEVYGRSKKGRSVHHDACWRGHGLGYCIIFAVSVACYFNAIWGDFVHDDVPAIVQNRDVLGETSILELFRNDFWGASMSDPASHKSYRPLTTLSFR